MKFKLFIIAAAACASLFGGVGVTEKRMTNYVKSVTTTLSNDLSVVIQNARPPDYDEVSALARGAATKVELVEGVSNIIDFITAENDASEPTFNDDGTITIVHIDTSAGYPKRIPITLRMNYRENYAQNEGFRVVSSSYEPVQEGALFACVTSDGSGGARFYNRSVGYVQYEKVSTTNHLGQSIDYFRLYREQSESRFDSSDAYLNRTIQVFVYGGNSSEPISLGNLKGSFIVEPYYLSDEEFAQTAPSQTTASTEWSKLADKRMLSVGYSWEQIYPAQTKLRKRFSIFDLLFPSALAASPPPPVYIPVRPYPMATKIDFEERYPDHEEDEYWEPRYWYLPADWNNPYNWVVFPMTITISYEYEGETYAANRTVSTFKQLQKYCPDLNLPPSPYSAPQLKKKRDYCKDGLHIYYNCVCSKCGAKRAHSYSPCNPNDRDCAQCENRNTSTRVDHNGNYVPAEDDGERCTHICDDAIEAYHAGWHHQYFDEENIYNCSCKCGVFSVKQNAARLMHDYSDKDNITDWHDAGDGRHHFGTVECERGLCRHENEVLEEHLISVITNASGNALNVAYYDSEYHMIQGDCVKCEAKDIPDHLQSHTIVGVAEGEPYEEMGGGTAIAKGNMCMCTVCKANTLYDDQGLHDIAMLYCRDVTSPIFIYCMRCGAVLGEGEHNFQENKPVDDVHHECFCGLDLHMHIVDETSKKCIGGKHMYVSRDEFGNELGVNWVDVVKGIDDGCGRDFEEDSGGGKEKIPCDTGKGLPDDGTDKKHIACGGKYSNDRNPPWRDNSSGCPAHTKSLSVGSWSIEWEDPTVRWWFPRGVGGVPLTILPVPYPVRWGTKRFSGNSKYAPAEFRVMEYATWGEWFDTH
jgi:hypothetical protein